MFLNGKTVLITGGTGSFGRKFVEIALTKYKFKRLIVFSRDELKQHEMRDKFPDSIGSPIRYFIGDIRDAERLYRAFHDVDIVIHAAALKQIPACEYNPFEAIQTNVIGAKNIINAAIERRVEKVLALSTDKAVNPVNLYGASKLCAEKLFIQGNYYAGSGRSKFSCTRYGNVIGSRGSVIPIFKRQRANGKITITDKRMTRFWLTLEQSVEFVIKCIGLMSGGEIFLPKIPSMNIMDLAQAVAPGCEIEYIGIRPGEKLHEMLVSEHESHHAVETRDMYIIQPDGLWRKQTKMEGATPLAEGFKFTSDNNNSWLTIEQLKELVG